MSNHIQGDMFIPEGGNPQQHPNPLNLYGLERNGYLLDTYLAGGTTYKALGIEFNITMARVRQICVKEDYRRRCLEYGGYRPK